MNLHRHLPTLFFLIVSAPLALPATERSWTNSSGKSIVATLVEISGDKAVLQMSGKNFEVPIATLSPDDQKFIAEWKKSDMTDSSGDSAVKPNWDDPWPSLVSVDIDQAIEVIKEDEAANTSQDLPMK